MRKLSAFLWLMLLFSCPVIAQENKVSVKKSGDGYMLEGNGKNFFINNAGVTKLLV
jgi:hypothetical protein